MLLFKCKLRLCNKVFAAKHSVYGTPYVSIYLVSFLAFAFTAFDFGARLFPLTYYTSLPLFSASLEHHLNLRGA